MFTYAVASDPAVAGFAMVSDRFLAVLAADADDAVALRLWSTLGEASTGAGDAGTTISSVLSALAADGIAAVPDFALVELVDAPTRAVALAVRGGAQILLAGGDVRTGDPATAWTESTAQEVTGLTLQLGPSRALLGSLPLGRGVVRADRLDWGPGGDRAPAPADATPAAAPAATTRRGSARRAPTEPQAPAEPPATAQPPAGTVRRERLAEVIDDRTELSRAHRRAARPVLRMGSDRVLELDLPVVFGRSPRPAAHPGARLVSLPSPRREISGAHLEVRLDGDALVARDLDSTNGTIVREPDGSMQLLRHGASARLTRGASLDLGDGNIAIFDVADGARG
ncbi:FHA domain-containing protein [Microbacterium sp. T2.11-28]|uniref:FHA domain-containing protein n=1 Tax=Microbacterium sp. T2.11-28 TaxID=3041169 RepID=UPI002477B296|nr:FHA domain-containing protein [Microbacterium sp. T2.11-28]CAI9386893.1 hypothetical protein MICABA_00656 [Microbacterium sp. T2.11-28]